MLVASPRLSGPFRSPGAGGALCSFHAFSKWASRVRVIEPSELQVLFAKVIAVT
jgi:hypothetical protein